MLSRRIAAEIIDIIAHVIAMGLSIVISIPFINMFDNIFMYLALIIAIILFFGMPILMQYLFWIEGRTVGKTLCSLVVVSEDTGQKADFTTMLTREIFCKWLSLWFVTIPVFFRKKGIHESSTQTRVEIYKK